MIAAIWLKIAVNCQGFARYKSEQVNVKPTYDRLTWGGYIEFRQERFSDAWPELEPGT